MSDLFPLYGRLRTTVLADGPSPQVTCAHRRRDELTAETREADPNDDRFELVTTETRCGNCQQITGREQHRERRR